MEKRTQSRAKSAQPSAVYHYQCSIKMDQEYDIITLDQSVSSINDDELLLSDYESSIEILEEDLDIVEIEVEEKITKEVNKIQKEVEVLSHEIKEVEVIFDFAEEELRKEQEALEKHLEEVKEIEEVTPAPSSELDTSDLIINTENDSVDEVLEEVNLIPWERKRSQESAGLDTSVQVLESEEEKEESDTPSNEDFKKPVLSKGDTVYVQYEAQVCYNMK